MQVAREKRIKLEAKQREQFREKQKERFSNKQIEKDLFQSQKACEQLDKAKVGNISINNNLNYFGKHCSSRIPPPLGGHLLDATF